MDNHPAKPEDIAIRLIIIRLTKQEYLTGFYKQPLNRFSFEQMLVNNLINILLIHVGVPDIVRIDNDHRPLFTAVETSCRINSNRAFFSSYPQFFTTFFSVVTHFLRIKILATLTAVLPLISAEKHMMAIIRHYSILMADRELYYTCDSTYANHQNALQSRYNLRYGTGMRQQTPIDNLIHYLDTGVRAISGNAPSTGREDPAQAQQEAELSQDQKQLAGRLMRINHAGEVAAQGLYQGQALTAKLPKVRAQMEQAAAEENDHLRWCRKRANELDTHTSVLDPLWYLGSTIIGATAGLAGDKWSLGFVAETEKQVVRHLESHLEQLPQQDQKSRAILEQMKQDELSHATTALAAGGAELPAPIKGLMQLTSKIMTKTTFWI